MSVPRLLLMLAIAGAIAVPTAISLNSQTIERTPPRFQLAASGNGEIAWRLDVVTGEMVVCKRIVSPGDTDTVACGGQRGAVTDF